MLVDDEEKIYLYVIYYTWKDSKILSTHIFYKEVSRKEKINIQLKNKLKSYLTKKHDKYVSFCCINYYDCHLSELISYCEFFKMYYETYKTEYQKINDRIYDFTEMKNSLNDIIYNFSLNKYVYKF